jgi:hypothetical protein
MRIALCISGQPRGIPLACEFLKHGVIDPNGITDIFVHTWYDSSCDNKPFDSAQPAQADRVGIWKPDSDVILQDTLEPTVLMCEKPNDFPEYAELPGPPSAVQSKIASIFYGMWKANELKKAHEEANGFKYDLVIRTRLDLWYRKQVVIKDLLRPEESLDEFVYTPHMYQAHRQGDEYYTAEGVRYSSLSDTFAFSNSENMDKFCSVHPDFLKLHGILYPYVYGESYLGYQARHHHQLKIALADIQYELMHRIMNMRDI